MRVRSPGLRIAVALAFEFELEMPDRTPSRAIRFGSSRLWYLGSSQCNRVTACQMNRPSIDEKHELVRLRVDA
jgi:hypothetical protein